MKISGYYKFLLQLLALSLACSLLIPKLILIPVSAVRDSPYGWGDWIWILSQDFIVAFVFYALLVMVVARGKSLRLFVTAGMSILVLIMLFVDMRVREMWLVPIDWRIVEYARENMGDFAKAGDAFMTGQAGWGMTFRRLLFVVGIAYGATWLAFILLLRHCQRQEQDFDLIPRKRRFAFITIIVFVAVVFVALRADRFNYALEENILVSGLLHPIRTKQPETPPTSEAMTAFDQKAVPLSRVLADSNPRRILADLKRPFRNIVMVVAESVRWTGMGFEDQGVPSKHMPYLQHLGSEGLMAKCHVGLPHSSKAYFSLLTGRYAYPGIEIREAMYRRQESIVHLLKEKISRMRTICFSALYLHFENLDGFLAACGVDERIGVRDLIEGSVDASDGFGFSDYPLYEAAPRILAESRNPFFTVFFPVAAHYPYRFRGKSEDDGDGWESYIKSVHQFDGFLKKLIESFRSQHLLDDTLFIIVGDHGESFGEHGTYIHNNSMYEEELTVPLIFWSSDGRLRHKGLLAARQIDIVPTIADLCGVSSSRLTVQGESILRSPVDGVTSYSASFFVRVSRALVIGNRKYIYKPMSGELTRYDLSLDPTEMNPRVISEGEEYRKIVDRIRAFIAYSRAHHLREK